ncbi:MAG TPA: 16S rRNA (cytidine(1402)-2'-O)-methyltransferase [bacterium]|nr:16S rRNA (cytidine(1402)-2'-O)-methyltransferase [bacterium]
MLYIVATPIGNLEDITLRALRILKEVDYILCEDTRVSKKLLDHYEITNKKLISYHHHSTEQKIQEIIELIKNNEVALITDAGTPGISDPGNILINKIVQTDYNLPIVPIPGASAVIAALSISGLPTDKFIFKGFVPHKKGRETFMRQVLESKETIVFYESCHRILKCLEQIEVLGRDTIKPIRLVVCRELTKKFETIYRGQANEVLEQIKKEFKNNQPKGEFVIVIN